MKPIALLLLAMLAMAACGGAESASEIAASEPSTSESSSTSGAEEAALERSDGLTCTVDGSIQFDSAIGWRITGPDGSIVDVAAALDNNGSPYNESNTYTLEGPREWLYTGFVLSASVTYTLESGGPVVVESFHGNLLEGGDGFGDLNITEVLEPAELAQGESVTFVTTNPCK